MRAGLLGGILLLLGWWITAACAPEPRVATADPPAATATAILPTPGSTPESPRAVPMTPAASSSLSSPMPPALTPSPQQVRPGLEVLLEQRLELIQGKRIALLTNQSGVDRQGRSAVDLLADAPGVTLVALFSPEHGWRGQAQAGESVGDARDAATGLPVYSLYGETRRPTAAQLRGVDALVVDLQDLGLRFYTYLATLGEVLQAGAEHAVTIVVLDRPAPLTGTRVEGNVLDPRFSSFVGPFPLPARYGLTLGEVAALLNQHFGLGAELTVVPMEGWRRELWHDQTGLDWVPPSPNLPTLEAATAYPGTVLFEGTNLSEGRGTPRPFQWIGAPWMDGPRWAETLNALRLPGVRFEPVEFTPSASKHAGQRCSGVALEITDRDQFEPIVVALHMLSVARQQHPQQFAFRAELFDLLAGTDETRRKLESGVRIEEIVAPWARQLAQFEPIRQRFIRYR